ncbi:MULTISPECIES: hypothetical protein [Mesorhizobium]|nr:MULTISPECIES: hypothetical protein [Mesorhizobium]
MSRHPLEQVVCLCRRKVHVGADPPGEDRKKCPSRRLRSRAACRRPASCFAGTMMIGVAITLSAIAILSILLRECLVSFVEGRSRLFEAITRSIEGLAGAALIALAIHEILLR